MKVKLEYYILYDTHTKKMNSQTMKTQVTLTACYVVMQTNQKRLDV